MQKLLSMQKIMLLFGLLATTNLMFSQINFPAPKTYGPGEEIEMIDTSIDDNHEVEVKKPEKKENYVHIIVAEMPQFPGCEREEDKGEQIRCTDEKVRLFIDSNIKLPESVKTKPAPSGRVWIQFIVEKNGELSNFKIAKDIGEGYGAAVLEALRKMPNWIPGKQAGEIVRVKRSVTMTFDQP